MIFKHSVVRMLSGLRPSLMFAFFSVSVYLSFWVDVDGDQGRESLRESGKE